MSCSMLLKDRQAMGTCSLANLTPPGPAPLSSELILDAIVAGA